MRTLSKIVLIIVLITLLYSVAKLISANSNKNQQVITRTWPVKQNNQSMQNNQNQATQPMQNTSMTTPAAPNTPQVPPTPDTPNAQGLYQADEILIDGQGKAGSNYIDITSDTPITPQNMNNANNTQNNNNGGAYAEASVNIDNNNNTATSAQTYAPGVPAFEVLDGN